MKAKTSILFFVPGFIFGAGLAISGMTNPEKVIGFLDIAGKWDPSLAFVMVGAIAAFAVFNLVVHRRQTPLLEGCKLPGPRGLGKIDQRLLLGSGIFGVGWALAGICPGPALTNLGRLQGDILIFVVAMAAGMFLARRLCGADCTPAEE